MKKLILIYLFIVAAGAVSSVRAQTPEFKLKLQLWRYYLTSPHDSLNLNRSGFGYDPKGHDSLNSGFGEADYPGGGLGQDGLYFEIPDSNRPYSEIFIRQKPSIDSFSLVYRLHADVSVFPTVLRWDHTAIPGRIRHILMASAEAKNMPFLDMTKQDSVIITTQNASDFTPVILTLYYNMEPKSGVAQPDINSNLLSNLSLWPNPFHGSGEITYRLKESARVHIVVYDQLGRAVTTSSTLGAQGQNSLHLGPEVVAGRYFIRLEASSGKEHEVKIVQAIAQ